MHWPTEGMYSLVYFLIDNSDKCYGRKLQFHSHQKWEDMTSLSSLPSFLKVLIYTVSSSPLSQLWHLLVLNTPELTTFILGLILCDLGELHRLREV